MSAPKTRGQRKNAEDRANSKAQDQQFIASVVNWEARSGGHLHADDASAGPGRAGKRWEGLSMNGRRWRPSRPCWRASFPAASASAQRLSRSTRAALIAGSDRSRSIATTAVGPISPRATGAGDPVSLVAYLAGVSQGDVRRGCSQELLGLEAGAPPPWLTLGKFAPLIEDEIAASQRIATDPPEEDAGELVSPVSAGRAEPPRSHPRLGKPTESWRYYDANGATLQIFYRF